MITFVIKSKSHVVFFMYQENKNENKEITNEYLVPKKHFLEHFIFLEYACRVSSGVELGNIAINGNAQPLIF